MELVDFLKQTQTEIKEELIGRQADNSQVLPFEDELFTEVITNHMVEVGMTFDNTVMCHYHAKVGNANVKISGYAISEELDQLDLYVSLYNDVDEITHLPDSETKKSVEYCYRFLTMTADGKLAGKIAENTEIYTFVKTIEAVFSDLDQIRIYVLTDCKVKSKQFQSREHAGKTIKLEVIDIERLYNHTQSGKPRDELVVNFTQAWGEALPCVWVPGQFEEYDYAMTVIPGEALRHLYDKYGQRILEANVRSFLSQTGKVNKGIRDTLRNEPDKFMAFNNGIVIVADEVALERNSEGTPGISWLKGMQIVNGGQTTASMFFTKKKYPDTDLSIVRVPAKIIVLKKSNSVQEENLITDIAKYANSQNAIRQSDLAANNPFHISIEKLALSTFCPDGTSRWFYERAAGSYKVMLEREGKTTAGINALKKTIPTKRKITKTDLAKFMCSWMQKPDVASLGGQKSFAVFMGVVAPSEEKKPFDPQPSDYKKIIAQVIIFKETVRLTRPMFEAFKANINTYSIACLAYHYADKINLNEIWDNQSLSEGLEEMIKEYAINVNELLRKSAGEKMISEWAKKPTCWEYIQKNIPKISIHSQAIEF
ncbi:abortive phage infection protein [Aliivibrio fischeri]|uniref:AIPR family protein n=1 Tax=Aliivibrio fischeri TaxID=668 RepID=UPI00080EE13D|nr:AIPR family protein [Aliivibrio fischeri]OCH60193.1 abortive phage infection protein [Aliivibrio fischeri]